MRTCSLGHVPANRWTFDQSVAECFDDMLRRSIPQYGSMRDAVKEVARAYVKPNTWIVDLGCSRGEALAPLVAEYVETNHLAGLELSRPMIEAAQERFAGEISAGRVLIRELDLRTDYLEVEASVTLAVLSLQFTPLEYRQRIVANVFRHTLPHGAFVVVEKILGSSAEIDAMMVENYHRLKLSNGYSQDEIDAKRHSLEGVLVPVTARWNEDLLSTAGFDHVDCFWRWMNFAGWIAVRGR